MRRPTKDGEKVDPGVLKKAQAYLACQARHETPNAELSQAFIRFFRICDPLLHRFASKCGVVRADLVDDCAEESWLAVVADLPQFPTPLSWIRLRSWLYRVVQSKAADLERLRTRHPTEPLTSKVEAALYSEDLNPAVLYDRSCTIGMVRSVLPQLREELSPLHYQVFYMRWIEERSVEEVAEAFGMTPRKVRRLCHRLKQKLRVVLSRNRLQEL